VGDPGGLTQPALGQNLGPLLDLEVAHHGEQVGVTGALAIPVDGALNVGGAGGDGREGVGHRATGVVVAVDPQPCPARVQDVGDDVAHLGRQHASVGIAQGDDLGPRLGRDTQDLQRVCAVSQVSVEEVLRIQEDAATLTPKKGEGVADHREVLGKGCAQS